VSLLASCKSKLDWSDAGDIADKSLNSGAFSESLYEISSKYGFEYYGLNADNYEEAFFYFSSGATAEEFVYLRAKDADALLAAKEAADGRISEQTVSFSYYIPAEVAKLESAKIYIDNKKLIIIVCVANDYDKLPL
jgi:hypothetical protein